MAAQSVVLHSHDDPVETYSTNVLGTVHILESIRRMQRGCAVVNVTTDKCYENMGWVWGYRESDRLGGHDPYSSSKACAELVGDAYRASFFPVSRLAEHGVALSSARAGNVIGGGDWTPRQLVAETMAAFLQGRPVALRQPDSVRPWQHVLDCLDGYMTLAEALARDGPGFSGPWNFGPEDAAPWSVSRVVEAMGSFWGMEPAWLRDTALHAREEPCFASTPANRPHVSVGVANCRPRKHCEASCSGIKAIVPTATRGNFAKSRSLSSR